MSLHCIYLHPESSRLQTLAEQLDAGDVLMLLGDAVALTRPGVMRPDVLENHRVCALQDDVSAAGIRDLDPQVEVVGYAEWVSLVIDQPNQCVWR